MTATSVLQYAHTQLVRSGPAPPTLACYCPPAVGFVQSLELPLPVIEAAQPRGVAGVLVGLYAPTVVDELEATYEGGERAEARDSAGMMGATRAGGSPMVSSTAPPSLFSTSMIV